MDSRTVRSQQSFLMNHLQTARGLSTKAGTSSPVPRKNTQAKQPCGPSEGLRATEGDCGTKGVKERMTMSDVNDEIMNVVCVCVCVCVLCVCVSSQRTTMANTHRWLLT